MVVTRADIYEKVILAERPVCPHCDKEMKIWECAETGFSCGSGWGTPYLFVCLNDACPPFVNGWDSMKRGYGRRCSYRCICFPDSRRAEMMMVFSYADCRAGLLDEAVVAVDRARGTDEDPAVVKLIQCFECRDLTALLASLFDDKVHYKVRMRAAELIGRLGLVRAIDPLHNHKFKDQRLHAAVRKTLKTIHEINRTQECPHCAEIVEGGATACSQCGRELGRTT